MSLIYSLVPFRAGFFFLKGIFPAHMFHRIWKITKKKKAIITKKGPKFPSTSMAQSFKYTPSKVIYVAPHFVPLLQNFENLSFNLQKSTINKKYAKKNTGLINIKEEASWNICSQNTIIILGIALAFIPIILIY